MLTLNLSYPRLGTKREIKIIVLKKFNCLVKVLGRFFTRITFSLGLKSACCRVHDAELGMPYHILIPA